MRSYQNSGEVERKDEQIIKAVLIPVYTGIIAGIIYHSVKYIVQMLHLNSSSIYFKLLSTCDLVDKLDYNVSGPDLIHTWLCQGVFCSGEYFC